jgi:hypothetical protein
VEERWRREGEKVITNWFFIVEAAKESLHEMPPRTESELDPVTLHNLYVNYGPPQSPVKCIIYYNYYIY